MKVRIDKSIESSNLREKVYEILKRIIVFQEISPGEKIDEDLLSSKLGVSRTPIRESLCRLENEGIVKIVPRHGAFVVKHSRERIIEILFAREALEGMAARLATHHMSEATIEKMRSFFRDFPESSIRDVSKKYIQADLNFHALVVKESRNSLLAELINTLNDHIQMLRLRTVAFEGRPEMSLSEHSKIIDAFEKKDPLLAESCMREHIKNVRDSVLRNIEP
jgi:DNA-binding GntR family transcriptional regulator